MQLESQIAEFMAGDTFAVAGASTDRSKYGNKVFRTYLQKNHSVVPINPRAANVEGVAAVSTLDEIVPVPHGLSVITPPAITERIVSDAIALGIRHIWMQPGAESEAAIEECEQAGVNLIHSGPCLLVVLGFQESA